MKKQIEICTGSYYDCVQAYKGGAKRVELNSALSLGGLTPSVASLVLTKKNTDLKVITMVRPRAAGFCYNEEEFETMLMDVDSMLDNGADGISFGCLDESGNIDLEKTKIITDKVKARGKEVVFHRAFDCVSDPYKAIEQLIDLGIDRILTSGCKEKAIDGIELLKDLQSKYGDKIQILPGSGLNYKNAKQMFDYAGVTQVHSSCKDFLSDVTTSKGKVSFAYYDGEHTDDYEAVNQELVELLVKTICD